MWQTIAVGIVVAAALFFAARRLVRTLRRKDGCGCGCNNCPMKGGTDCHRTPRLPDIEV